MVLTPAFLDFIELDNARVGVWELTFDKSFERVRNRWANISFNMTRHILSLGSQDATTGHYAVTYPTTAIIDAIFWNPMTKSALLGHLGIYSQLAYGLFTADPVLEGDLVHMGVDNTYWMILSVMPHFFGDSFLFYECSLSRWHYDGVPPTS